MYAISSACVCFLCVFVCVFFEMSAGNVEMREGDREGEIHNNVGGDHFFFCVFTK